MDADRRLKQQGAVSGHGAADGYELFLQTGTVEGGAPVCRRQGPGKAQRHCHLLPGVLRVPPSSWAGGGKANSIYAKGGYTDAQAQRNILSNPFKRFEDMQMLHHTKTLGVIQVDESVWKKLTQEEKTEIERICDEKNELYFSRLNEMIVGR